MNQRQIIFRIHALRRMFERCITETDVVNILETGKVIANYPDDRPFPSKLILGWKADRPIHVVVAENKDTSETIIITAYEPDILQWTNNFEKRRNS